MDGNRNIILGVLLALLLPSCTRNDMQPLRTGEEISFRAISIAPEETRGIVEGTTLWDDETGGRKLRLSSYLYAQSGRDIPYFCDEDFIYDDGAWRHNPALYWPMGGRLDFLGFSSSEPFDDEAVVWGANNPALRMRITVDEDRTYDDILYGALWGQATSNSSLSLPMRHAQAWIEFRARRGEGAAFAAVMDSVVLERAYLGGVLNVENNYGNPVHSWDFRRFAARRVRMSDRDSVCGRTVTDETVSLSMLLPEQEMCSVSIHWRRDGSPATNVITLPHGTWLAGRHYIYEIRFGGAEADAITIEQNTRSAVEEPLQRKGIPWEERF